MTAPRLSHNAHVLVVDGDAINRTVARTLSQMFGATSEDADSAEQAITLSATGAFDLVLMDIHMPLMDGVEASYGIRSLPGAAGRVPIIALTGVIGDDLRALCFAAGVTAIVEKPVLMQHLYNAMEAALQGGSLTAEDVQWDGRGSQRDRRNAVSLS